MPRSASRATERGSSSSTKDLNTSLPRGPFDLVVSFFAIHHVQNKERLVEKVFESLAPSGLFLYQDITVAADPELERAFQDGWVASQKPPAESRVVLGSEHLTE